MSMDRRTFVQGSASAATLAALSGAIAVGTALADAASDETVEADIVVVGGGGSGLAAAIQAVELGASVVLLEKKDGLGGNASMTEGIFGVGSPMQKEAGIADIPLSELIEEEMVYTNFRSCGPLLDKYFSASGDNIQWLIDMGVAFKEVSNYRGISSFDCFHWWEGTRGYDAFATIAAHAEEVGVDIRLKTAAEELILEGDTVAGVIATNTETGETLKVMAKAVILASGGFAGNAELIEKLTWVDGAGASATSVNTGAGMSMALSVGAGTAAVCGLYKTQVLGEGISSAVKIASCFQPLLMVNEFGERFTREDLNITSYSALYFNAINSQRKAFTIIDANAVDVLENQGILYAFMPYSAGDKMEGLAADLAAAVEAGNPNVYAADTLEELAEAMGIAPKNLMTTVERYNELCEAGQDTLFGKGADYLIPVTQAPYYAVLQSPIVYVTIGGIDVDTENQVVDPAGAKIANLYSAGVDCCKLYRETYNYQLSGGMVGYCIYSGRNAAQNACAAL